MAVTSDTSLRIYMHRLPVYMDGDALGGQRSWEVSDGKFSIQEGVYTLSVLLIVYTNFSKFSEITKICARKR